MGVKLVIGIVYIKAMAGPPVIRIALGADMVGQKATEIACMADMVELVPPEWYRRLRVRIVFILITGIATASN
jgi:hypothetical protein